MGRRPATSRVDNEFGQSLAGRSWLPGRTSCGATTYVKSRMATGTEPAESQIQAAGADLVRIIHVGWVGQGRVDFWWDVAIRVSPSLDRRGLFGVNYE